MKHSCHANQCTVPTPRNMLMCKNHWFKVPKDIQDKIWSAFKKNPSEEMRCKSVEYMESCAEAVEYIATLENLQIDNPYRRIANKLKSLAIMEVKNIL